MVQNSVGEFATHLLGNSKVNKQESHLRPSVVAFVVATVAFVVPSVTFVVATVAFVVATVAFVVPSVAFVIVTGASIKKSL